METKRRVAPSLSSGIFFLPRKLTTLPKVNLLIGLMINILMILRILNPLDGMIFLQKLLILMPKNLKIGMMI